VSEGTPKDIDIAVEAAQTAFDTVWGLKAPGAQRSILMAKLSALMERDADELAALEALDNGAQHSFANSDQQFNHISHRQDIQLGKER
jgi:aldehyde dehydrogenase (NAD+)